MSSQTACRNQNATAVRRVYIAFGAAIFVLAHFLGGIETHFTDNLYNQGLVARSAQGDGLKLETAYKHWFFDGRPAERPEDWHRSASLLAYAAAARLWPEASAPIVRFAHSAMFTLWALMIMALAHALAVRQTPCHSLPETALPRFAGLVVLGMVGLLPFLSRVGMDIYLDDLPAALMALAACGLLLSPGAGGVRPAGSVALAGAAFWMKDLYLVWVLCAPVVAWILISPRGNKGDGRGGEARAVALFSAAMLALAGSKIAWNIAELGLALPDQARIALNARLIQGLPDAENQFFHHMAELETPTSYLKTLLANDPAALLVKHGLATLTALKDSGLMWLFLLTVTGAALAGGLSLMGRRVLLASLTVSLTFGAFFAAGLGEAGQLRYWLMPFSGALALVIALAWQGLCAAKTGFAPSVYRRLRLCFGAGLALMALPQGLSTLAVEYGTPPPFTEEFMAETASRVRPGESVLVQLHRGTYFWSKYPQLTFTGISTGATQTAACGVLRGVARQAKTRLAAMAHTPAIQKLQSCGFRLVLQTDEAALLALPDTGKRVNPAAE